MLLKQPYQNDAEKTAARNVVKNLRSKMLPEKKLRNSVVKNNGNEMLLRKLPLETFAKNIQNAAKKIQEKVPLKTTLSECC